MPHTILFCKVWHNRVVCTVLRCRFPGRMSYKATKPEGHEYKGMKIWPFSTNN